MKLLESIINSRIILKEILKENDWNTDNLPIYSIEELNAIYNSKSSKGSILNTLGNGSKCSFILEHNIIPDHKLHVLYYNFPDIGKNTSKITKSIYQKINQLYELYYNKTDNILLIINDKVTENINNMIDNININNLKLSNTDNIEEFNEIIDKFKNKGFHLRNNHFGIVHILSINSLQINIQQNIYVPQHICIKDIIEIEKILKKCNCKLNQLPIINKSDIICRLKQLCPGDICKIIRSSKKTGDYEYYRLCK